MDINSQLLREHSKENKDLILNYLIEHPQQVSNLMEVFFKSETMMVQRAAWVVGGLGEKRPELIKPYHAKMVAVLKGRDAQDAVKRNILRVLQFQEIEETLWGDLYDCCIRILTSNLEPVAVKVFAMTTAYNIVKEMPELKGELLVAVEDVIAEGTPGEKSRGQKILTALSKI